MQNEAENAGILTDSEDDNEVLRKIDRKGCLLFIRYQYKYRFKTVRFSDYTISACTALDEMFTEPEFLRI